MSRQQSDVDQTVAAAGTDKADDSSPDLQEPVCSGRLFRVVLVRLNEDFVQTCSLECWRLAV